MQQKMTMARSLCLGGIMIWAIDQDNTAGDSMDDLLGIGKANGVPDEVKQRYKQGATEQARRQAVASSCYWSLCGGSCTTGYFDVAEARGSASGVQRGAVCGAGEVQTLCCAPGTTMGSCKWEGFRGVAFPCSPACSDPDATLVARNTNSYTTNEDGQVSDLTCMGGYQAYCCKGFIPSSITNSGNLVLYGQSNLGTGANAVSRRNGDGEHGLVLQKRGKGGALGTAAFCAALAVIGSIETLGLLSIVGGFCAAVAGAVAAIGFIADLFGSIVGWIFGGSPSKPNTGSPTTIGTRSAYGQWPLLDFGGNAPPGQTTTSCDCVVTYTCRYGMGWDEICDNQRWAINKVLNGRTVFQPLSVGRGLDSNRQYGRWRNQRRAEYRTLVQGSRPNQAAACQLDEFPMGNLRESRNLAPQACRLVNGLANGAQGRDYDAWKSAQWRPCSSYRHSVCHINDDGPPATWKFNALGGNSGSGSGKRFLDAFGFDSQTPGSSCFASFTFFEGSPATRANTMIVDHGFRVLDNDPMFGAAYGWPRQNYRDDPGPFGNPRPYNLQPVIFQKRARQEVLAASNVTENTGNSTDVDGGGSSSNSQPGAVCHIDLDQLEQDRLRGEDDADIDARLDYDQLLFVDMAGDPVDGRTCDVIYEDRDPESRVRIAVDEDGNVVDVYTEDTELWGGATFGNKSPVTAVPPVVTITAGTRAGEARPGSGEPWLGVPVSTTLTMTRVQAFVTRAPAI